MEGKSTGRDPRIYPSMSEYKNFNVIRIGCPSPWLLLVLLSDATCARASSVSSVDAPFFHFFSRMRARIFCFRRLAEMPDGKSEAVCAQISIHAALLFVKLFCHLYLSGFRIEYMTRGNGQRDAYSQVGLVDAIDGSRYRFRFLS